MSEEIVKRSVKNYDAPKLASAYQKQRFIDYQNRVKNNGEPMVLLSANQPMEILLAMDIPFVVNQWYTGLCAAKQLSSGYFNDMEAAGYKNGLCGYCSTAFAGTFASNPEEGPYGGLPKQTIVVSEGQCASSGKIMEIFAQRHGAKHYRLENTSCTKPTDNWWEKTRHHWKTMYEEGRLEYVTDVFMRFISFLEEETGKTLNINRLNEVMRLINEQEEYYAKIRDLITEKEFTPITLPDVLPAVMQAQWNRGTPWAVEHAKNFYEEIKAKADAGFKAVPNEKIRLAWIGLGMWQNLAFYQYFEEKFGAAFIWSMYLAIASDNYVRYDFEENPVQALASRDITMSDCLGSLPMNTFWYIQQFKANRIDAVVINENKSCAERKIPTTALVVKALRDAGYPVLVLDASNTDSKLWDQDKVMSDMENFIQKDVLPNLKK